MHLPFVIVALHVLLLRELDQLCIYLKDPQLTSIMAKHAIAPSVASDKSERLEILWFS